MPEDFITSLILTLQQHPTLALFFVFLVAFSESLIIIGVIVPGVIFMILFGALIAMDALAFWPTVLVAIGGAIAGDSLSYWLGRRYQNKLHNIWPLSRHPELIVHANQFFQQHGVKSVVLSRFVGPLRAIIPAIAGMSRMPVKIFFSVNVCSAIIWAPLYLLPGILFGLSLEMASEFAGKFIVLIIFILLIIMLSLWAIQRLYIFTKPYNDKAISYFLNWGESHSLAGEIPSAIFDGSHSEIRGLSLVAFIIFSVTLIFNLLHSSLIFPLSLLSYDFDPLNQLIYNSLQTFRSPPFDSVMLWLNYVSSSYFIAMLCFSIGSLFILKKNFFPFWHWLAAIFLALILSPLLSNSLTSSLQQNLNTNISSLPFIVVICCIGFLTIIMNAELSFKRQKLIYYFSASLVLFLMLAQLYFATQVFSQVLFGMFVGIIWFNLLGIAYRHHIKKNISRETKKQVLIIIAALLIYPSWKTIQEKVIYLPPENYFVMGTNGWIESGWKLLPTSRQGIYPNKNNLFNLQWLANKNNIQAQLIQLGFTNKLNTIKTFSNWLLDDVKLNNLPVLPHMHNGEYETLRFYHYNKDKQQLTVIRLWPSKYKLTQDNPLQRLWFGSISIMQVKQKLGFKYLVTNQENVKEIKLANKDLIVHKKTIFNNSENKNNTIFLLK